MSITANSASSALLLQTTSTQRVPTALWENFQDLWARVDDAFLRDVAHITKIPFIDLRRLFPTRGVITKIATDTNVPWWYDQQCHMSVKQADSGMWIRCCSTTFEGRFCIKHRNTKFGGTMKSFEDPYFATLPKRLPYRLDDMILWVDECTGRVYTHEGSLNPDLHLIIQCGWLDVSKPLNTTEDGEETAKITQKED